MIPDSDDLARRLPDGPAPRRRRRTGPQWLVLGFNLAVVVACVVTAVALVMRKDDRADPLPPVEVPTTVAVTEPAPVPVIESLIENPTTTVA